MASASVTPTERLPNAVSRPSRPEPGRHQTTHLPDFDGTVILSDCTGATDHGNHLAALKMVTMQGGVFGAVSNSAALMEALTFMSTRP